MYRLVPAATIRLIYFYLLFKSVRITQHIVSLFAVVFMFCLTTNFLCLFLAMSRCQKQLAQHLGQFNLAMIGQSQTDDETFICRSLKEFGRLLTEIDDERTKIVSTCQKRDAVTGFLTVGGALRTFLFLCFCKFLSLSDLFSSTFIPHWIEKILVPKILYQNY